MKLERLRGLTSEGSETGWNADKGTLRGWMDLGWTERLGSDSNPDYIVLGKGRERV